MTTACQLCRGACCESLLLPLADKPALIAFYATRGAILRVGERTALEVEARCRHLGAPEGHCTIYSSRPQPCVDYAVGSVLCRDTVLRRRSASAEAIFALLPDSA